MSEIDQFIIEFLRTIADQTRLDILRLLKNEDKSSAEIREALSKSHSTISQHLKSLVERGVIEFYKKKVTLMVDKPKNPGKAEVGKDIKFYKIKDNNIFELLTKIQTFVIGINKEKMKDIRDLGVLDTLL